MKLITVHSKVITDTTVAAQLYYYIRSRDQRGSGWVRIGIKAVMEYFSRSRQAIKRWCQKAKSAGLFYAFEIGRNHIFVKYASVKKRNEITGGCFANARVDLEVLKTLNGLKATAYEAAIKAQQSRVEWSIVNKSTKKLALPLVAKPKTSGDVRSSELCPTKSAQRNSGFEHYSPATRTLFVRQSFEAATSSQLTLAANLGRHRSTIIRWTKDIEHEHVYQRVTKEDLRVGHRITVRLRDKRNRRVKHYLRRPNYYHTYINAGRDRQMCGSLPQLYRAPKTGTAPELEYLRKFVPELEQIKRTRPHSFRQLLKKLSLTQLQDLADAVLLRFRGRTTPQVRTLGKTELLKAVDACKGQLNAEQFSEFLLMTKQALEDSAALLSAISEQTKRLANANNN